MIYEITDSDKETENYKKYIKKYNYGKFKRTILDKINDDIKYILYNERDITEQNYIKFKQNKQLLESQKIKSQLILEQDKEIIII